MSERPHTPAQRITRCEPLRYEPTAAEVDALIHAASQHALGVEFLRGGHLGSVAMTFQAHAFTVIAARARLSKTEN